MSFAQPLSQALTPKKSHVFSTLLLVAGLLVAIGAAAYGYLESRRTERVVIAVRSVPFGQQISADDLGTIELPLHRPVQLAGITSPQAVIGRWAGREIGPNDLVQPAMLLDRPPDQPVYPSGQQLSKDMVALPFSTQTIGPLTEHDLVNVGFSDPKGDPALCRSASGDGSAVPDPAPPATGQEGRPYACRLLQRVRVLYVDEPKSVAYLEVTPYQAHAIWSLQAAGLQLWGERYGLTSDPLAALDRLDASQITTPRLTASVTETLQLNRASAGLHGFAGSVPDVPGSAPLPGAVQPTPTK